MANSESMPPTASMQPEAVERRANESMDKLRGVKVIKNYRIWLKVELVVLCIVIVVIWGLLAIPIIIYQVPTSGSPSINSATPNGTNDNFMCTSAFLYNGTSTVCEMELLRFRQCLPDAAENSDILVFQDGSETVNSLLDFLELDTPFFRVSQECRDAAIPILCLFFFGPVCDSTGVAHRPSTEECLRVSTNTSLCGNEWQTAQAFGISLPDCHSDMFGNEMRSTTCVVPFENQTNTTSSSGDGLGTLSNNTEIDGVTTETTDLLNGTCSLECSKDFYCKSGVTGDSCAPTCQWKELSDVSSAISDAFVLTSAVIGILFGIVVMVTACIRRRRVFTFPSVIVIYQTITLLVVGVTVLIAYMDRAALFCSSQDLLESVNNSTPFCIISGILFYYCLLQLSCWWICHVGIMFWKVKFPFQARSFEMANHTRYLHAACILISVLFPLLPVLVTIGHDLREGVASDIGTLGFGLTKIPPILCTGTDGDATFYSLVLPIILVLDIGTTLLIIMFWFVHKQHGLFKANQAKNPYKLGTAEKKLLFVILYYVVLTVVALSTFTISSRDATALVTEIFIYFVCEQSGYNPSQPCDRSKFESLSNPVPANLSYILLGLFPCVNLVFTINFRELKKFLQHCACKKKRENSQFVLSEKPSTASSDLKSGGTEKSMTSS